LQSSAIPGCGFIKHEGDGFAWEPLKYCSLKTKTIPDIKEVTLSKTRFKFDNNSRTPGKPKSSVKNDVVVVGGGPGGHSGGGGAARNDAKTVPH
jgi:hypothetical protein